MNTPPFCPFCGQTHAQGTRFCPVTGNMLPTLPARRLARGRWVWESLGILSLGILLIGGIWLLNRPSFDSFSGAVSLSQTQVIPQKPSTPLPPNSPTPTPTHTASPPSSPTALPSATPSPLPSPTPPPPNTSTLSPLTGLLTGKIAFTCQIFRDDKRNQICLINADGTGWTRLTHQDTANQNAPSFAPDGNTIFYSSNQTGSYDLFEIDLNGNEQQITDLPGDEYAPAVSPDGQWIVFTYHDGAHQTLWLQPRAGGDPYPITYGSEREAWDPAWSPDGTHILFASGANNVQLFIMEADGTDIEQVTNLSELRGRNDWSPDGVTLATYQGTPWHREIILVDLLGQITLQLTDGGNNLAPSFSPYGGWLALTSYKDHFGDDHGCEIYVMRLDASETLRLTDNDYCDWQARWGP